MASGCTSAVKEMRILRLQMGDSQVESFLQKTVVHESLMCVGDRGPVDLVHRFQDRAPIVSEPLFQALRLEVSARKEIVGEVAKWPNGCTYHHMFAAYIGEQFPSVLVTRERSVVGISNEICEPSRL